MDRIRAADVASVLGRVDGLLLSELLRTEATVVELRDAVRLANSPEARSPTVPDPLDPRMRRLIDLCGAATAGLEGRSCGSRQA